MSGSSRASIGGCGDIRGLYGCGCLRSYEIDYVLACTYAPANEHESVLNLKRVYGLN
jgi:hypothetical protein